MVSRCFKDHILMNFECSHLLYFHFIRTYLQLLLLLNKFYDRRFAFSNHKIFETRYIQYYLRKKTGSLYQLLCIFIKTFKTRLGYGIIKKIIIIMKLLRGISKFLNGEFWLINTSFLEGLFILHTKMLTKCFNVHNY